MPKIKDHIVEHPGDYKMKKKYLIPDMEKKGFWYDFYKNLASTELFQWPIKDGDKKIDPYFGFFGTRCNPVDIRPQYFHIGLDISDKVKTKIYPVTAGILEYSGYGVITGNYVLLSHPNIVTKDGYKLYSMYAYLKETKVGFTSYQKMLREISLHNYPTIPISQKTCIGLLGNSGNIKDVHPHLHFQLEFRNKEGDVVAVDPVQILGASTNENITASVKNVRTFFDVYDDHQKDIHKWKLDMVWKRKKKDTIENKKKK